MEDSNHEEMVKAMAAALIAISDAISKKDPALAKEIAANLARQDDIQKEGIGENGIAYLAALHGILTMKRYPFISDKIN